MRGGHFAVVAVGGGSIVGHGLCSCHIKGVALEREGLLVDVFCRYMLVDGIEIITVFDSNSSPTFAHPYRRMEALNQPF